MKRLQYLQLLLLLFGVIVFCAIALVAWVVLFLPVMLYPRLVRGLSTENTVRFTMSRMMGAGRKPRNGTILTVREDIKPLPSLPVRAIASARTGVVLFWYRENGKEVTKMMSTTTYQQAARVASLSDPWPSLCGMADHIISFTGRLVRGNYDHSDYIAGMADQWDFTRAYVADAQFYAARRAEWTDEDAEQAGRDFQRAAHDLLPATHETAPF